MLKSQGQGLIGSTCTNRPTRPKESHVPKVYGTFPDTLLTLAKSLSTGVFGSFVVSPDPVASYLLNKLMSSLPFDKWGYLYRSLASTVLRHLCPSPHHGTVRHSLSCHADEC